MNTPEDPLADGSFFGPRIIRADTTDPVAVICPDEWRNPTKPHRPHKPKTNKQRLARKRQRQARRNNR
jgi:hypothetical protein